MSTAFLHDPEAKWNASEKLLLTLILKLILMVILTIEGALRSLAPAHVSKNAHPGLAGSQQAP